MPAMTIRFGPAHRIGQGEGLSGLPGFLELIRQPVDAAEHILRVEFLHGLQVVQDHMSSQKVDFLPTSLLHLSRGDPLGRLQVEELGMHQLIHIPFVPSALGGDILGEFRSRQAALLFPHPRPSGLAPPSISPIPPPRR